MSAVSAVKMRISREGITVAARKNAADTMSEIRNTNASNFSTLSLSPFPQNCAANILAPMVNASINKL